MLVLPGHSWSSVNIWVVLIHVVRAKLLLISSANSSAHCSLWLGGTVLAELRSASRAFIAGSALAQQIGGVD